MLFCSVVDNSYGFYCYLFFFDEIDWMVILRLLGFFVDIFDKVFLIF